MHVFYINLDHRVDRREHMENMLTRLNLDYTRVPAVKPTIDYLRSEEFASMYKKSSEWLKQRVYHKTLHVKVCGMYGAYLSQYKAHKMMENKEGLYIILEDDVVMTENTQPRLNAIINDTKYNDWDIIRSLWDSTDDIERITGVNMNSKYKTKDSHNLYGGAHFSVFNNANRMIKFLDDENIYSPDGVYSTDRLNVYHSKLDVRCFGFGSDITDIDAND